MLVNILKILMLTDHPRVNILCQVIKIVRTHNLVPDIYALMFQIFYVTVKSEFISYIVTYIFILRTKEFNKNTYYLPENLPNIKSAYILTFTLVKYKIN